MIYYKVAHFLDFKASSLSLLFHVTTYCAYKCFLSSFPNKKYQKKTCVYIILHRHILISVLCQMVQSFSPFKKLQMSMLSFWKQPGSFSLPFWRWLLTGEILKLHIRSRKISLPKIVCVSDFNQNLIYTLFELIFSHLIFLSALKIFF